MNNKTKQPHGKEEVKAALFDAAAYCFATRGIAATSVREIAAKAQVNHGLIHRHFGSKDQLLRALLKKLATDVHQRLNEKFSQDTPTPSELLTQIFANTASEGFHWQVVLRALLEGIQPEELQTQFPVFTTLTSSYQAIGYTKDEALAEAALAFSTGLGFLTFQEYIKTAVHKEGGDWSTVKSMLMQRFITKLSS